MGAGGQIPSIVSQDGFDPQNPDHLQAFEEEMQEMVMATVERQRRMQHVRKVTNSSTLGKLSLRELELAAQGLSVQKIRHFQEVGAFWHPVTTSTSMLILTAMCLTQ